MAGIDVIIDDPQWTASLGDAEALAARCFTAAVKHEPKLDGVIALLLADDRAVRALNEKFRGLNKATNVLSFPSGDNAPEFLGDIAIAYGVAVREAAENQAPIEGYIAHLLVHGLLHLVGYDHENDADAEIMEALESEILDVLGVYNPYAAEEPTRA